MFRGFGGPQYGFFDPYSGYTHQTPYFEQAQQPRRRPRQQAAPASAWSPFDEYEAPVRRVPVKMQSQPKPQPRRIVVQDGQLAERARLAQEKQIELQKERIQKQKVHSLRMKTAAKKIQRLWRSYQLEKQHAAAKVISKFLANFPHVRVARNIVKSLKSLRAIDASIRNTFSVDLLPKASLKELYVFQDALERKILSVDIVSTHGHEFTREYRKSVINHAQDLLAVIDTTIAERKRAASRIKQWYRRHQQRRLAERRDAAAETITTFLRGVPQIKDAKRRRDALKELVLQRQKFLELKAVYEHDLRQMLDKIDSLGDLGSETVQARRAALVNDLQSELHITPVEPANTVECEEPSHTPAGEVTGSADAVSEDTKPEEPVDDAANASAEMQVGAFEPEMDSSEPDPGSPFCEINSFDLFSEDSA